MTKWELTTKIGHYLDRHLVFPLLEFLTNNKIYDKEELLRARHELAKDTMMLDYAKDVFEELYPGVPIPRELDDRRDIVLATVNKCHKDTDFIRKMLTSAFENEELKAQLAVARDARVLLDYLVKNDDFQVEWMDEIYTYAKYQFECGNYELSSHYMYVCQLLQLPSNEKCQVNLLWGKLAAEILKQSWEVTFDEFVRLKEYVDGNNYGSALVALQQRTWLIHWSLFVFYNHSKGQDALIDMFLFQQQYLNAIQTTCPHILRYLTATVIINKQRPSVMKELVKVIQQESYHYKDPITEFVECLYVNFDFDGAQKKLRECEEVLKHDFFLISCLEPFIESARMVIFETFCCIHQCISITMLADKLNMTPEAAEKWIVNLIRNARLDAKIDSRLGHVVMSITTLSPYQQLIEKTKVLSFRAQLLASNLEKKVASNLPERVPYWAAQEF